MTRRPEVAAYVLDTWPIMAYLEEEPAAEAIEQLLVDAHDKGIQLLMTVVNVAEVWYIMARQTSTHIADQSLGELKDLGIQFVPASVELALRAAGLKAKHKMSLADCFAAALAQERTAELVTGDQEFKQAEPAARIFWV